MFNGNRREGAAMNQSLQQAFAAIHSKLNEVAGEADEEIQIDLNFTSNDQATIYFKCLRIDVDEANVSKAFAALKTLISLGLRFE